MAKPDPAHDSYDTLLLASGFWLLASATGYRLTSGDWLLFQRPSTPAASPPPPPRRGASCGRASRVRAGKPALGLAARQPLVLEHDVAARQPPQLGRQRAAHARFARSACRRDAAAGRPRWRRSGSSPASRRAIAAATSRAAAAGSSCPATVSTGRASVPVGSLTASPIRRRPSSTPRIRIRAGAYYQREPFAKCAARAARRRGRPKAVRYTFEIAPTRNTKRDHVKSFSALLLAAALALGAVSCQKSAPPSTVLPEDRHPRASTAWTPS